jgi:acetyltransferase-like isoleucine patch superfamily enzyme
MISWLKNFHNRVCAYYAGLRLGVAVDTSARVNFRHIRFTEGAKLRIGHHSIFLSSVAYERPNAEFSVGDYTQMGGGGVISTASSVAIGSHVLIAWNVQFSDHNSHALDVVSRVKDTVDWYEGKKDWSSVRIEPIIVEDYVWIGFQSIILRGVTIGRGAVVAAGSVVTRSVEPFTVVGGNPARLIRRLTQEESVLPHSHV